MRQPQEADLSNLTLLLAQGPTAASPLQAKLGISQPTLSRRLKTMGARVEVLGRGRSQSYALRRPVRQGGSAWPVFEIDPSGRPATWGELIALHGGFRLRPAGADAWLDRAYPNGLHGGLPFILQDLAPQGFLGRAIAREVAPLLHVAEDPRDWSDDDRLTFMLHRGYDLPGNLVIGEQMLARALRSGIDAAQFAEPAAEREARYPILAEAAMRGEVAGSSAGGEQPKFLTTVQEEDRSLRHVLVKFSAADPSPIRQRWLDLLACEHLAARVIADHGLPAVQTSLLQGGTRRFLEITRFDRTRASGRLGVVSLGALHDGLLEDSYTDWIGAATALGREHWISSESSRQMRWLWCFGDLIGNTDMHFGNACFQLAATPPFPLAPAYDMLPMRFAPDRQGELRDLGFAPRPPLPAVADVWPEAARAAHLFWTMVEEEVQISDGFRRLAASCRHEVARWQETT